MFVLPPDRSAAWVRPQRTAKLYLLQPWRLTPLPSAFNQVAMRPEALAGEKLVSRQVALKPQQPVDWSSLVGNVSAALKQQAVAARAASWAKTLRNSAVGRWRSKSKQPL